MGVLSVCIFCSKASDSFSDDYSSENVIQTRKLLYQNFNRILKRYLESSKDVNIVDLFSSLSSGQINRLETCEGCKSIIQEICDGYHQLKCIQLRLDWMIQSLRNIMKMADKIKSRKHLLKMTIEGNQKEGDASVPNMERTELYRKVKKFRRDFMKNCSRHFATSFPRVLIARRPEDVSTGKGNRDLGNIDVGGNQISNPDLIGGGTVNTMCSDELTQKEILHRLIKWNLGFSMLIMLCLPHSNPSSSDQKSRNNLDKGGHSNITGNPHPMTENSITFVESESSNIGLLSSPSTSDTFFNYAVCNSMESPSKPSIIITDTSLPECPMSIVEEDANDDNVSLVSYNSILGHIDDDSNNELKIHGANNYSCAVPMKTDPDLPQLIQIETDIKKRGRKRKLTSCATPTEMEVNVDTNEINNCTETWISTDIKPDTRESVSPQSRYHLRASRPSMKSTGHLVDEGSDDDYIADEAETASSDESDATIEEGPPLPAKHKTFQCKTCNKFFKTEAWLMFHQKKAKCGNGDSSTLEYTCEDDTCRKVCRNEDDYEYHKKLHGEFQCKFCDKVETFAPDLCIHEETHSVRPEKKKKSLQIYHCPQCPYQISHKPNYIRHHLEKHLNIVKKQFCKWECPICKSKVILLNKDKHFRTHHDTTGIDPENIFNCTEENCSAHFLRQHQYQFHLTEVHQKDFTKIPEAPDESEPQPDYFSCKLCSKTFKLRSWLNQHMKNFHDRKAFRNRNRFKTDKKYFCKVAACHENFRSKEGLERHSKLHGKFKCNFCEIEKEYAPDLAIHETEHAIQTISESLKETSSIKQPSMKFNCPRCPYMSSVKNFYITHHVHKHLKLSMKTGSCKICGIEMTEKFEAHHFRTYHNTDGVDPSEIHKCDECPAYFILGIQLLSHKDKKHQKEELNCVHCGMTFSTKKYLVGHVRLKHQDIDESSLPEACEAPNCGRRFATKPELEWHTTYAHIYHEKYSGKMKCKICDKICLNQNGLRVHMRHHQMSGKPKKMHVCDLCGKSFKMKCFLEKHSIFHADPSTWKFECSECSKKCSSKQKLEEHMRTHSKEKPFVCELCGQKYAHRHNYRAHMKSKHGVEVPTNQGNKGVNAKHGQGGRPRKIKN